jgi:uncharacterized protein
MSFSGKEKKKYMEPVIHFLRKRVEVFQNDLTTKMSVSEFVKAGSCLADFPDFAKYAEKGFVKTPLEAGSNTQFSRDGDSLVATVPGYPKIETGEQKEEEEPTTIISIEPLVSITPDRMQAKLRIQPPVPGAASLVDQDLSQLLADTGVVYGIDPDVQQEAQTFIKELRNEFAEFTIANGKVPGISSDASIQFEIEIGPLAGRFLDDGTIDFRERRIMVGVCAGQHIATKIPVVPGDPGINVLGEVIEPAGGKDIKVRVSNDAAYSEEDMKVTAVKDGVLSVVNNSIIKVCSRQVILGDIDYKTGNVESNSCLTIRGSIQPGFKVSADGDLEIGGSVMSATVLCQANVVVKGGITGKNSLIKALGDVDIRFIEQGAIESGGIVVIRTQSYYSRVAAASDIRCQKTSKVMGGDLIAGGHITVSDVGSENCDSTFLAAGVDAERLVHHKELQDSIVEQQKEIIRWLQLYGGSTKSKKIRKMEQELADTKLKLLQLNLIPGTGLYSRGGGDDDTGQEEFGDIGKTRIDVHGTIYAGTRIRIGNRVMVLDRTVSKKQFRLHKNLKSIVASSIR